MNKQSVAALLLCGVPALAAAQSIGAPSLNEGDTWTYVDTVEKGPSGWHQTHDQITLERVTDSHIYAVTKQDDAPGAGKEFVVNADWARARDIGGTSTVVAQPLAFPMETGKHWDVQYTETHPANNPRMASITWTAKYKVVGYEDIAVPAGKFHALKIEAEGNWRALTAASNSTLMASKMQQDGTSMLTQINHATPTMVSGDTYKAVWYAPEVGRWVKSVEEYYGSNGVRNERYTSELESYKRSGS